MEVSSLGLLQKTTAQVFLRSYARNMILLLGFQVVLNLIAGYDSAVIPVKYLGCLIQDGADETRADHASRRGPFIFEAKAKLRMNIQECVSLCFELRYKIAAIQNGTHCFCAENTRGMITRTDDFCHERCPGNCRQRCGGLVTMSVYTTGYQREPDLTISDWLLGRGLIGCLKKESVFYLCGDEKRKPNLKTIRMTAKMCTLYCASGSPSQFMWIGVVVADNECCCGMQKDHAHNNQDKVGNHLCNIPCRAAKAPGCVGHGYTENGKQQYYVTVYDVDNMRKDGIPNEAFMTFRPDKAGWMDPTFPDDDKFELKDGIILAESDARHLEEARAEAGITTVASVSAGKVGNVANRGKKTVAKRAVKPPVKADRKGMPELHGEKNDLETKKGRRGKSKAAPPIIDPENTGVKVVDVPSNEDEEDLSVATTVLELLACLLLMAGIGAIILKKKKAPETPPAAGDQGNSSVNAQSVPNEPCHVMTQAVTQDTADLTSGEETATCTESDGSQLVTTTDDESLSPLLST